MRPVTAGSPPHPKDVRRLPLNAPSGRPPRFSRPRTSFALAPPSARSLLGRGSSTSVAHGCAPHSLPSPSSRPGVADSLRKGERKTSCPLRPDGPDCLSRSVGRAPHAGTSGRRPEMPEAPRSRPAAPATATPWVPAARMKKHPKPAPLGAGSGRTKPFRFMRKCARGAPLGYRPAVIPANLPQSASPHGKRSEKPKV